MLKISNENFRDITDRIEVENSIQEQYALLTAITEGSSDSIFIKDLDGCYVLINSAGAEFMGKPKSEIIGMEPDTISWRKAPARRH